MKPRISLIAAVSENNVIGKDNQLIWHIPDDLQRFRALTSGHPVIMGRKTYESIGRPLPRRTNIVISTQTSFLAPGCEVVHSLEDALSLASKEQTDEIFVIGGGHIYTEALKFADRLYITKVHKTVEGDAFFPEYSAFSRIVSEEDGSYEGLSYTYFILEKNN